jgi:hypothetical protein
MTPKGNFTALQALTPLKGSIVDDLQAQTDNGFKRKQLKMQEDELAAAKAEKERKRKEDIEKGIKAQVLTDTGSKTKNEALTKAVSLAHSAYGDVLPIIENPEKYSTQEVIDARIKFQNLNSFADNLLAFDKTVTARDLDYRTKVAKGEIWENKEYENNYQAGYANKSVGVDKQGMPIIYFIDNNNDGLDDHTGKPGKIGDFESYADMESGVGLDKYKFQPRFSYDALLTDATTKIQPDVNQTDNGITKTKTTGLDLIKARGYAQNVLLKADGSPTPEMISIAKERGLDASNPDNQKQIVNDFVRDMSLRTKKGVEVDKENPLEREKFNYQKAKDKEKEKPVSFEPVETPPIYEEARIRPASGYKTVAVTNGKPVPLIQLYVPGDKKAGNLAGKREITNGTMNSYTVTKDKLGRRRVYVEMVYQDSKSSTLTQDEMAMLDSPDTSDEQRELLLTKQSKGPENKSVVGYLSQKDLYKFAKQNKMTTSEMANKARVGKETNQKPKTVVQNGITYTLNETTGQYE